MIDDRRHRPLHEDPTRVVAEPPAQSSLPDAAEVGEAVVMACARCAPTGCAPC
nr:hypothetical protein [Halomonas elongata]